MAQNATRQPDPALLRKLGARPMLLAALIVTAVFVLSNSPTPLFVSWQRELGFSAGMLTVIFAAYMVGLLLTLTVAGQFADRFGRKSVLIPGLVLALVACSLFGVASSVLLLVIARFLTGVAVGVIVSAGMAAVVDLGGPARRRQASLAASVAMVFGAGLGPLLSGLFAQGMVTPAPVIFAVEFVLLATALVIAIFLPLPRPPASQSAGTADAAFKLHLPSVPKRNQRHLAYGIAVFARDHSHLFRALPRPLSLVEPAQRLQSVGRRRNGVCHVPRRHRCSIHRQSGTGARHPPARLRRDTRSDGQPHHRRQRRAPCDPHSLRPPGRHRTERRHHPLHGGSRRGRDHRWNPRAPRPQSTLSRWYGCRRQHRPSDATTTVRTRKTNRCDDRLNSPTVTGTPEHAWSANEDPQSSAGARFP